MSFGFLPRWEEVCTERNVQSGEKGGGGRVVLVGFYLIGDSQKGDSWLLELWYFASLLLCGRLSAKLLV